MSESSKGPIFGLVWFGLPSQRYSVRVPKSHGEVEIKAAAVCPPPSLSKDLLLLFFCSF